MKVCQAKNEKNCIKFLSSHKKPSKFHRLQTQQIVAASSHRLPYFQLTVQQEDTSAWDKFSGIRTSVFSAATEISIG